MFNIASARKFLDAAGVFFGPDEDEPGWEQVLNLNDAFYWGGADCEEVEDEELPRLAELFFRYGWAGLAYWVLVEKRGDEKPEFVDVRRFVEFVRNEEAIRKELPSSSKRAYAKRQYTIGEVNDEQ